MENLPKIRGEYRFNYDLSKLTWFKVGGKAKILFKPLDIDDLSNFLQQISKNIPIFILGAGSNIIIRDGGFDGIVIKLGKAFANIAILDNGNIQAGAAVLNYNLAQYSLSASITGFEFLTGIPGTIGGGIEMNAGCYGSEFKDILLSAKFLDQNGQLHNIAATELGFGYRCNKLNDWHIFIEGIFASNKSSYDIIKSKMNYISEARNASQPTNQKTGGSTFANPENKKAWQLIDEVGLRGHQIGGAHFSDLHTNFMINDGTATAEDLENLGEFARSKIYEKTGIDLKWEIKIIGKKSS